MKSTLKLFIGFVAISVLFLGCKKDEKNSSFKVGTTSYDLSAGYLDNFGLDGEAYNLDLYLYSDGIDAQQETDGDMAPVGSGQVLYFYLFSSSETSLDSRVYEFGTNDVAGRIHSADYTLAFSHTLNGSDWGTYKNIVSGTITVSKSGNEYEIDIDGTDVDGTAVTGYYKGALPVYQNAKKSTKPNKEKSK